jgi:hypothetical protein
MIGFRTTGNKILDSITKQLTIYAVSQLDVLVIYIGRV